MWLMRLALNLESIESTVQVESNSEIHKKCFGLSSRNEGGRVIPMVTTHDNRVILLLYRRHNGSSGASAVRWEPDPHTPSIRTALLDCKCPLGRHGDARQPRVTEEGPRLH